MPVCLSQTSTVDIVSAGLIETMLVVAEEKKKKTSPQRTER